MRAGILLLSSLLAVGTLRAEEDKLDENLLKLFEPRVYRDLSGGALPYRLYRPANYDLKQKYPLVLFLHGAVGAGKDNRRQFNGGNEVPVKALTAAENQAKYPCFIVAPQCPTESRWARYPNDLHPTEPTRLSLAVLTGLPREFSIDRDRLYIVGLSMGGFGVWDLISHYPNLFAAAVPICSGGDTNKAPVLVRLPIWCFHGDADPLVPVHYARDMIAAIKRAGGHPKYTEYPGVGHNSYVNAFKEPELLPWLFEQKRHSLTTAAAPDK